jgi:hypothetical protein
MQSSTRLDELLEDKRGPKRTRVLLSAKLLTGDESFKANLLNLSASGALLDATVPPAVDTPVTLARGNLEALGRVVWVNGHRFGMTFDALLDEAVVAEQIEALKPRRTVVPFR